MINSPGWRPEISKLEKEVFSVSNLSYSAKLDQNESAIELDSRLKEFILEKLQGLDWRLYHQADFYREAKLSLADYLNISPDELMITTGGDQVIQGCFIISKPRVLIFEPTYPMYRLFALHNRKKVRLEVLNEEFKINPEIFNNRFDLVNIVSPNNPTGNTQSKKVVEIALGKSGLVLVDEAYYEFSNWTMKNYIKRFKNLFIARTFSKTLSMAGLRMGYCISNKENIKILEKVMFSPYNVNILTLTICKYIKKFDGHINKVKNLIIKERSALENSFKKMHVKFLRSTCNFIAFKGDEKLYKYLAENGVRVRNISGLPGMNGYLRVTIGKKKENKFFISILSGFSNK